MNEQVQAYVSKYPPAVVELFRQLRQAVIDSAPCAPEETLWARLPSYCVGDAFVRLIPFKDHINVEASAILLCRDELPGCKITPKGMLQLYPGQEIPHAVLAKIFTRTLCP